MAERSAKMTNREKYIVKEIKLIPVFTGEFKYDIHFIYRDGHENVIMEVPADKIELYLNVNSESMLDALKSKSEHVKCAEDSTKIILLSAGKTIRPKSVPSAE